jgi:hypothetical protein
MPELSVAYWFNPPGIDASATYGLIGTAELRRMKDDAILASMRFRVN